jgi:hypothetical protein
MYNEKPEAAHELTAQQLVGEAKVHRHLAQPSPWLVEAPDHTKLLPNVASPVRELTEAELQRRERVQEHLARRSPWLK